MSDIELSSGEEELQSESLNSVKFKRLRCWSCRQELTPNKNDQICPRCNSEFAEKPKNEANLHILQKKYLENRDSRILGQLLFKIKEIVYNLNVSKLRTSGKFLDEAEIEDNVADTVEKMFSYYTNKPDFRIDISFIQYLSSLALYPLYNYKKKLKNQKEISINTPIKGKKDSMPEKTLLDLLSESLYLDGTFEAESFFFQEVCQDNLIQEFMAFKINSIEKACREDDFSTAFKLAILFNHFFRNRSDRFFNMWWSTDGEKGLQLRKKFETLILLMRNVVRESASV